MTAFQYVQGLSHIPGSREGASVGRPSNSELRRWFKNGSVRINGSAREAGDRIRRPITELVFFLGSRSQTTMILDNRHWRRIRRWMYHAH